MEDGRYYPRVEGEVGQARQVLVLRHRHRRLPLPRLPTPHTAATCQQASRQEASPAGAGSISAFTTGCPPGTTPTYSHLWPGLPSPLRVAWRWRRPHRRRPRRRPPPSSSPPPPPEHPTPHHTRPTACQKQTGRAGFGGVARASVPPLFGGVSPYRTGVVNDGVEGLLEARRRQALHTQTPQHLQRTHRKSG
jgi:hypothetical protein